MRERRQGDALLELRPRALTVLVGGSLALAALGTPACKKERADPFEGATTAVGEPAVPAPDGLLADVVLATPNTTWGRLQRGIGGALGILPATLGGLVCTLGGLDPGLAPEIDGAAPAFAVVTGDPASPSFTLAVHLVDPRHARAVLVTAPAARFTAREEAGMTVLAPRAAGAGADLSLGITPSGYLLLARDAADLGRVAPYAYRTLPRRPLPASALAIDVPAGALAGPIRARLAASWDAFKAEKLEQDRAMRAQHGGRAPDFGDPQALMGSVDAVVQRKLALLADLAGARVAVDAGESELHAEVSLRPASGGAAQKAVEAMATGDVAPLFAAPLDAPLAFVWRDDAAGRASDAADVEQAMIGVLGARLSADDAKRLHGVVSSWSKGRGDGLSGAATAGARGGGRGLILRAAAVDGDELARAVRGALELLRAPAFKEPLRSMLQLRDVTVGPLDAGGTASRSGVATLSLGAKAAPKLGVAWSAAATELRLAVGEDAGALLASASAPPPRTLGDDAAMRALLAPLGGSATFALVAQPLRLDSALDSARGARGGLAPIVVAWGRRGSDAWGRIDVADALAREIARALLGL